MTEIADLPVDVNGNLVPISTSKANKPQLGDARVLADGGLLAEWLGPDPGRLDLFFNTLNEVFELWFDQAKPSDTIDGGGHDDEKMLVLVKYVTGLKWEKKLHSANVPHTKNEANCHLDYPVTQNCSFFSKVDEAFAQQKCSFFPFLSTGVLL